MFEEEAKRRFAVKVDRNGPVPPHRPELGACHVWNACRTKDGYGLVRFAKKTELAHRVAFLLHNQRWPDSCALHHCDNPSCVNPEHLFEGTQLDNIADRGAKRRQSRGEAHGASVRQSIKPGARRGERNARSLLTENDVRDIRANYALCRVTQKELGERYGVTQATISSVIRGACWKHAAT
jgi:hypothetical protein